MIKVLVLEDEKGLCDDMKEFFTYRGYKVFSATSGDHAVSIIRKEDLDILVLDIKMKGTDGLKVLKQAKEKNPKVKAIMITALIDDASKRRALELGASEYIKKPFSYDELEAIVIHIVNDIMKERGL
jgi:DNA-binding response OmpR family regulator